MNRRPSPITNPRKPPEIGPMHQHDDGDVLVGLAYPPSHQLSGFYVLRALAWKLGAY